MHDHVAPPHPRLRLPYDDRYLDDLDRADPDRAERRSWGPAWAGAPEDERLTELVFIDGRLVSHSTGSVAGSAWAEHAARLDREQQRPAPPAPTPVWQDVLGWLADRVGGQTALTALDSEPLGDPPDLPEDYARDTDRQRVESVADLLDAVARSWFDAEVATALRTALLALWREDPRVVTGAASAAASAAGITWAVAKANGLIHPVGGMRVGTLRDFLGLRSTPSTYGAPVRAGLIGFRQPASQPHHRPLGVPDLLDLGRADLLTAATRARLVHLRDRAVAARDAD